MARSYWSNEQRELQASKIREYHRQRKEKHLPIANCVSPEAQSLVSSRRSVSAPSNLDDLISKLSAKELETWCYSGRLPKRLR